MTTANQSRVWRIIPLLITVYILSVVARAQYGGGTGEPDDPYQIWTSEQMNQIGANSRDWHKNFILMNDIDLSTYTGRTFNIIGSSYGHPFNGIFNGNSKIISNFTYARTNSDYIGLFGCTAENAEIKNLGLVDPTVEARTGEYVGSLVGCSNGTMIGCYAQGVTVLGNNHVGGLVGSNGGSFSECHVTGIVSGNHDVGGLAGYNSDIMYNCYTTAIVIGGDTTGGLVGWNNGIITICYSTACVSGKNNIGGLIGINGLIVNDSYSTGNVSGDEKVGGLVGGHAWDATITNCYSTGNVSGNEDVGGLLGLNSALSVGILYSVKGSFWNIETSGQATSPGGTGKTTIEMHDFKIYQQAGWDFIGEKEDGLHELWQMPEGGCYPVLAAFYGYTPPKLQGLGTFENPYLISDGLGLGAIIYYSSRAHYRLVNSIDLIGIRWCSAVIPSFAGTFDGNNLTISNLTIQGGGYLGLFGKLKSGAEIKDLGAVGLNITGSGSCNGGLVGNNRHSSIINCYITGIVKGNNKVGGLVGANLESSITRSYSKAKVTGYHYVGGLVGQGMWGSITRSHSNSTVNGSSVVGGLAGCNWNHSIINCYSSGRISGDRYIGGLVGLNREGTINNAYSTDKVNGNNYVAGLVGINEEGNIISCFWDMENSGFLISAGGVGKTTAEMQTASTFLEVGWDFVGETINGTEDIWWILEGQDYPRLWWETEGN